jgi:hypothetical protein
MKSTLLKSTRAAKASEMTGLLRDFAVGGWVADPCGDEDASDDGHERGVGGWRLRHACRQVRVPAREAEREASVIQLSRPPHCW